MAASIRATLCTLALFAVALTVAAENTVSICAQITGAGNISIDQPEALARLLEYSPAAIVPENGDEMANINVPLPQRAPAIAFRFSMTTTPVRPAVKPKIPTAVCALHSRHCEAI